jgi:DNA-binding Xre family transcriptional regulator
MQLDISHAAKRFKQWSLYRLAIELDVPNQTIYSWNSGKIIPSLKNLTKICEALNCTPNDLFGL